MSSLLDASPPSTGAASYAAILGTIAAHGLVVALASYLGVPGVSALKRLLPVTEMVEVELPEPPKAAPAAPAPAPAAARPHAANPTPAQPPPSAAQAGQVLDAKSEVVDFGDSFVTGQGDAYAGGVTDSSGTSTHAVQDTAARGDGVVQPPKPAAPAVDLSRPPRLAGSAEWRCPFPVEADDAGIDHALVSLRVEVESNGSVGSVVTSADPGNGFGREARRCAGSKAWLAGLDRLGRPIKATATVNVRFDR